MRKKLISMLLAIALLSNSSMAFGNEQEINDNAIGSTKAQNEQEEGTVIKGDQFVLTMNSKSYLKNGQSASLTAAPLLVDGRCYIPLRFMVDQVLEGELNWNAAAHSGTISKDQVELEVTVDSKSAALNGQKTMLVAMPIIRNSVTYVPLRLLSDYFGVQAEYAGNKIMITGKDKGINHKPIASFYFAESSYTEGQKVTASSTSYDPDGHKLAGKEWCVITEDQTVTHTELSNIFKNPKAGTYTIGLRVKDQYGLWSDWSYKGLTVNPNKAPEITYLGSEKNSYAQGEKITYQYFYENESWESITNEKWTYRHAEEDVSKAILGKPDALFTEGDYIVALQLDDAYGNRSEVYETTIHITEEVLKKELSYRFTEGNVGDIIDNYQGFNYRDYEDAEIMHRSTNSGTMIMSDSPEEVTREGILYRDVIDGQGRLLIHHINKFSDASVSGGSKRLVVVVENTSSSPATLTLSNKTIKGPVTDILYLGQKLLYDYLAGSPDEVITLQPGERQYIYDSKTSWKQGMCISGLMDITTTGEVTFTMAAVSAGNTINNMDSMELFLQAVHPRGTFEETAINYTLHLDGMKPTKLLIGTGEEEWVKGYDALTQDPAHNKGNYGVSYYITITATEDTGIILNPRANVFRGAIEWQGIGVYNIPTSGTIFSNTAKAVSLGTVKAGETKTFEYMLPNGSSAPVLIGFIPRSYWDD